MHSAVHTAGEFHVVGRDQGGEAGFPYQRHERREDLIGCGGVQVSGGFVRQQQAGGVGEGAAEGDALLFAAG